MVAYRGKLVYLVILVGRGKNMHFPFEFLVSEPCFVQTARGGSVKIPGYQRIKPEH